MAQTQLAGGFMEFIRKQAVPDPIPAYAQGPESAWVKNVAKADAPTPIVQPPADKFYIGAGKSALDTWHAAIAPTKGATRG